MKLRIVFTVLVLGCMLVFLGCSQTTPHEKLLGHYEKILSILNENKTDINKAAQLAGDYIKKNIDEIRSLYAQFEKEPGAAITKDSIYVERQAKLRTLHLDLEMNYPLLLNSPQVIEAIVPMRELWKAPATIPAASVAPDAALQPTPKP